MSHTFPGLVVMVCFVGVGEWAGVVCDVAFSAWVVWVLCRMLVFRVGSVFVC